MQRNFRCLIRVTSPYATNRWYFGCLATSRGGIVDDVWADYHWNKLPSSLLYKQHQISTLKIFLCCLAAVFAESLEPRCQVENEDVVRAAPTGDAPTTSEWSTILLPTNVRLILEILRYWSNRHYLMIDSPVYDICRKNNVIIICLDMSLNGCCHKRPNFEIMIEIKI